MDIMTSNGVYCTFPREERLQRIYRFFDDGSLSAGQPSAALEQAVSRFASAFTFVGSLADVPSGTVIYKIGSTEIPAETVVRLKERFSACPDIATASTFPTDIELTNVRAQKGLALKPTPGSAVSSPKRSWSWATATTTCPCSPRNSAGP